LLVTEIVGILRGKCLIASPAVLIIIAARVGFLLLPGRVVTHGTDRSNVTSGEYGMIFFAAAGSIHPSNRLTSGRNISRHQGTKKCQKAAADIANAAR
jgi:hypothetical protein